MSDPGAGRGEGGEQAGRGPQGGEWSQDPTSPGRKRLAQADLSPGLAGMPEAGRRRCSQPPHVCRQQGHPLPSHTPLAHTVPISAVGQ